MAAGLDRCLPELEGGTTVIGLLEQLTQSLAAYQVGESITADKPARVGRLRKCLCS